MAWLATSPGFVDTTIRELDLTENCPSKSHTLDRYTVLHSIAAGSLAGMVSCALFHPFDVIRTKIQASSVLPPPPTVSPSSPIAIHRQTVDALDIMRQTFRSGGLYTGLSLPLAAQALYKATIFTTNQVTRSILLDLRTQNGQCRPYLSLFDYFTCGATSGAINALLFVSPVEYVRNQLIIQHSMSVYDKANAFPLMRGPMDVIRNTYHTHGILGLWRGTLMTVARDSVGCGAFFFMFEVGQQHFPLWTGRNREDLINSIASGFLAGFGFWAVALPLDSLKTLEQAGAAPSAREALVLLIQRYGSIGTIRQLYRGWQFGFGRGSPSAAVTLTVYASVYEYIQHYFG
jgi:ornithine carrier protein